MHAHEHFLREVLGQRRLLKWTIPGIAHSFVMYAFLILGSVYVEGIRIGVALMESGQLDMAPLVTHRFPLADINRGFEAAVSKEEGFVKGVVTF